MLGTDSISVSSSAADVITAKTASFQTGVISQMTTDILYAGQSFFTNRPRATTGILPAILTDSYTILSDVVTEVTKQVTLFSTTAITFTKLCSFNLGINIGQLLITPYPDKCVFTGNSIFTSLGLENSIMHFTNYLDNSNKIYYESNTMAMFYLSNNHIFSSIPKTISTMPTLPTQLTIKSYVDQEVGKIRSLSNNFLSVQFFSQLPICNGNTTPNMDTQLITKSYVDSSIQPVRNYVDTEINKIKNNDIVFLGADTFNALTQFRIAPRIQTIQSSAAANDFITRQVLDRKMYEIFGYDLVSIKFGTSLPLVAGECTVIFDNNLFQAQTLLKPIVINLSFSDPTLNMATVSNLYIYPTFIDQGYFKYRIYCTVNGNVISAENSFKVHWHASQIFN